MSFHMHCLNAMMSHNPTKRPIHLSFPLVTRKLASIAYSHWPFNLVERCRYWATSKVLPDIRSQLRTVVQGIGTLADHSAAEQATWHRAFVVSFLGPHGSATDTWEQRILSDICRILRPGWLPPSVVQWLGCGAGPNRSHAGMVFDGTDGPISTILFSAILYAPAQTR
jgi:hypothetical protein